MTTYSYSDRVARAQRVLAEYEGRDGWMAPDDRQKARAEMAEALRAMVEISEVRETPAEIAKQVWRDGMKSENSIQDLLVKAVEAGIQAAWNSWEPDDYAPEPEEPIDLSQYSIPGFGNMQDALDNLTIRPVK